MEKLKEIKCALITAVQGQTQDLKHVNTKELGEVIDAIKDLEEACYYAEIIQAMEDSKEKEEKEEKRSYNNINYYMEPVAYPDHIVNGRKMYDGRAMYDERSMHDRSSGDRQYYVPYMEYAPYMMRDKDWREDKLSKSRRTYVEGKMNKVKDTESMQDLEHYIKDLGDDLTDMIQNSSPEEKQMLSQKLQMLATKVNK